MGGAFRHVTLAQGRCCCGLGITPLRAEDRAREAPPQRKVDAFGETALAGCEKTILACQKYNGSYAWDKPGLSGSSGFSGLSG